MRKNKCGICCHGVMDMEKHLESSEHKRQVVRANGGGYKSHRFDGAGVVNKPKAQLGLEQELFPGRLVLKRF